MKYIKKLLSKALEILVEYADLFTIKNIRSKKTSLQAKKNLIFIVITDLCYLTAVIMNHYFEDGILGILLLMIYSIPLILLLMSCYLWYFDFCPEKEVIKKLVHGELVIRITGFFLAFINYRLLMPTIDFKIPIIFISFVSLINILLGVRIYYLSKKINIDINNYNYEKDVSNYEVNNFKKLVNYTSYLGIILYILSINLFNEKTGFNILIIKLCFFLVAIKLIENKLHNFYEDKVIFEKKSSIIKFFLTVGFIINIFGMFIINNNLFLNKITIKSIEEILLIIGIIAIIPLGNEYAKIGKRISQIRDYMEKKNINIF